MRGFVCQRCDGDMHVTDSRPKKNRVLRRRECLKCGARYSTLEVFVEDVRFLESAIRLFDKRAARGRRKEGNPT